MALAELGGITKCCTCSSICADLVGSVPAQLVGLRNLHHLDLADNQLEGGSLAHASRTLYVVVTHAFDLFTSLSATSAALVAFSFSIAAYVHHAHG